VRAAVRMLQDLDYCNTSAGVVNAETGIGINTGKVAPCPSAVAPPWHR